MLGTVEGGGKAKGKKDVLGCLPVQASFKLKGWCSLFAEAEVKGPGKGTGPVVLL